jgi:hypothetical protein
MSDYYTPGTPGIPDPKDTDEPRTPPLDDPGDEGPGGVPDLPEEPDDSNVEVPEDPEHEQEKRSPGRGTVNEDQPGRQDRSTERGGDEQG